MLLPHPRPMRTTKIEFLSVAYVFIFHQMVVQFLRYSSVARFGVYICFNEKGEKASL